MSADADAKGGSAARRSAHPFLRASRVFVTRGLMAAVLDRDDTGELVRRAGVMAVVLTGGQGRPDDPVAVELPPRPHAPLQPV